MKLIFYVLSISFVFSLTTMSNSSSNDLDTSLSKQRLSKKVTLSDLCVTSIKTVVQLLLENNGVLIDDGLMACYERIMHGKKTVYTEDLIKAYKYLRIMVDDQILLMKAFRPDAPQGLDDGSVVGTIIGCDLNPVLERIQSLRILVMQCCATVQAEILQVLQAVQSLTGIVIEDFNATFTALNEIRNDLLILTDIVIEDFNGTFTALHEIHDELVVLTDIVVEDFNSTFTSLNTINNEIIGTQTSLDACCSQLAKDFNGTFTSLDIINNEIIGTQTSLDACCAQIEEDFNGTFTVLDLIRMDLAVSTGATLGAITETKDTVISTKGATQINAGTTIGSSGSYFISKNVPGTITITSNNVTLDLSGNTLFSGVVVQNCSGVTVKNGIIRNSLNMGAIQLINCSDIALTDLKIIDPAHDGVQCNGVTGLFMQAFLISGAANNGITFLTNPSTALQIQEFTLLNNTNYSFDCAIDLDNLIINNGSINGGTGIRQEVATTVSRLSIYDVTVASINNSNNYAFNFLGTVNDLSFNNLQLATVIGGIYFAHLTNAVLKDCVVKDIVASSVAATVVDGIRIDLGSGIQCDSCIVEGINDGVNQITCNGFGIHNAVNLLFKSCVVQSLKRQTATLNGFLFDTCDTIQIMNSTVQTIQSIDLAQRASGFNFVNSTQGWLNNCTASECSSSGFVLQGTSDFYTFNNCFSLYNNISLSGAHGFELPTGTPLHVGMQYCQGSNNDGNGFEGGAGVVIGNSVAMNNSIGFDGNLGMIVYNGFAQGNTTNYMNLAVTSPIQLIGATPIDLGANIDA